MADQVWLGPNDRRKRRETRFPAVDVSGTAGGVPIRIRDVSLGGLGARCDQAVRAGRVYAVVLAGRGASVSVQASARWCRMSVGKDASGAGGVAYYGIGFQFEGLTDEQRRGLESVLGRSLAGEESPAP